MHAIIGDGGIDTDLRENNGPLHLAITYQDKYSFITFDPTNPAFGGLYTLDSSYQDTGQCSAVFNRESGRLANSGYVDLNGIKSGIIVKVGSGEKLYTSMTFTNLGYNINHLSFF